MTSYSVGKCALTVVPCGQSECAQLPTLRVLILRSGQAPPPLFLTARGTPVSVPSPQKERGRSADRRWVRNAAPHGPPRGRADLRIAGDQPADDAGRRASRRSTAAFFGPRAALHWAGAPARISELLAAGS